MIIDTDMGGDDASALILAAKSRNIEILGVTVLAGNVDLEQATNCDGLAMMCVTEEGFVKKEKKCHASCITEPGEVYGMVVLYSEGFRYDSVQNDFDYEITLVNEVDGTGFFERYLKAIR